MKLIGAALLLAVLLLLTGRTPARPRPISSLPSHFVRGALCIYSHENGGYGWSANTGNGYYGGMQMDRTFQQTYGRWLYYNVGTADRWSRRQQIIVSWRAYKGWRGERARGFYPWPNTARMCGLI